MKIVIGCDHAGFGIKNAVKEHIASKGYEVVDVGTNSPDSCHYPLFADAACKKILDGECALGILICGTGVGMSIAANKHKGIRAACCSRVSRYFFSTRWKMLAERFMVGSSFRRLRRGVSLSMAVYYPAYLNGN